MPIIAAVTPVLPVRDLARAMDFYRTLGFSAQAWRNGTTYAFIHRDEHQLHLRHEPSLDPATNPTFTYFYLHPHTAEALQQEFQAANAPITETLTPRPWGQREFVVRDPDGNILIFGESLH